MFLKKCTDLSIITRCQGLPKPSIQFQPWQLVGNLKEKIQLAFNLCNHLKVCLFYKKIYIEAACHCWLHK